MPSTAETLYRAARLLHLRGIHRGDQFARLGRLDVSAAIFLAAEGRKEVPAEFFTDELDSIRLIECSAPAMQAIRALSDGLESEPSMDTLDRGVQVPNYIEHVSNWAATPPIREAFPPSTAEIIGRLRRTAADLDDPRPHAA